MMSPKVPSVRENGALIQNILKIIHWITGLILKCQTKKVQSKPNGKTINGLLLSEI